MACVCESTRPGVRTPRRQSISIAFGNSARSERSAPAAIIVSPSTTTAASVRDSNLLISGPRRARGGPAHVTTCDAFTKMSWDMTVLVRSRRAHHVANAREPERRLRLTPAGIIARIAIDRLIRAKIRPVKIGGKVGAAFHAARRIEVNRANT